MNLFSRANLCVSMNVLCVYIYIYIYIYVFVCVCVCVCVSKNHGEVESNIDVIFFTCSLE